MSEPRKSARERLAEFERSQKGQRAFMIRALVLGAILLVAIGALFFLGDMASPRADWRKLPERAAKLFSDGHVDEIGKLLAPDFEAEVGGRRLDRRSVLQILSRWSDQGPAFTTRPITAEKSGDTRTLTILVVHAQGDVARREVIPIVRAWRVTLELAETDAGWVARRATVTPALGR